jgi:uncharacterized lipoprotein YmbA
MITEPARGFPRVARVCGAALAAAIGLSHSAACGTSPRARFHTLSVAAGEPPRSAPGSSVQVAAVHLPRSLDRREMVAQTGANAVDISEGDRWAAPLADIVRRVLSQDLATRMPAAAVVMPGIPPAPDTAQLIVSLLQFGPDGRRAILVGSWSLSNGATVFLRRDVSFSSEIGGRGGDAVAAAMSDLVGQLATNIATALAETRAR